MNIVEITSAHHEEALALAGNLKEWFGEVGLANMTIDLPHQRGLVVLLDDRLVGFATWFVNEGSAYIGWLAVDPTRHRQGIGSALIEKLKRVIRSHALTRLRVWTLSQTVDYLPYEHTRSFYRAMGFKSWQQVPGYCKDGSDMEIYQLVLGPSRVVERTVIRPSDRLQ